MIVMSIERPLAQVIYRMSVVSGKKNFDRIYDCKDPRPYFTTLRALDYRIHRHAIPIFARSAKLLSVHRNLRRIKMVDLCAGYGVNAALLRFRVTLDDLYTLYNAESTPPLRAGVSLEDWDRRFFASRLRGNGSIGPVIAIDKAECAIRYAESVGLVDYGASEDLEDEEPSTELRRRLLGASLVTVTGGMGYIGPRTMENILANVGPSILPWIIAFPLVGTPLEPFSRVFSDFGLRVEVWNNETFPQRRVANGEDHFHSVSGVCNHAPSPSMSHVYLQTRLLCARPADEADVLPLSDIM